MSSPKPSAALKSSAIKSGKSRATNPTTTRPSNTRVSPEALERIFRKLEPDLPEAVGLRIRRATSWLYRANIAKGNQDTDAQFIFLWIAFSSLYETRAKGIRQHEAKQKDPERNQRRQFAKFFQRVVDLDRNHKIYNAIWEKFTGPIRVLMDNHYIFGPYWDFQNGVPETDNWERRFTSANRHFRMVFAQENSAKVLTLMFDRLYVLRNQLMHGCATWKGSLNRSQLRDGTRILEFLLPIFVGIVMEHPKENWGEPSYPRMEEL